MHFSITAIDNHGTVSAGPVARFTTRESPWFLRAPMPLARRGFTTVRADNKIYVIGGLDENNLATSTVQEYDPALNSWNSKASMPTPCYELAAAYFNNRIYAIGGEKLGRLHHRDYRRISSGQQQLGLQKTDDQTKMEPYRSNR
ncbi:hypothetical protein HY768_09685 [candidate division TA06 bacterium]|uniref:Kelch-like protein n=1 Tax=candidate division TA06 bacterium TaxID=2250710 RepID=A0A933ICI1_UNCT6|nr:hypothetical protein [candidate division TA06 bacterium]